MKKLAAIGVAAGLIVGMAGCTPNLGEASEEAGKLQAYEVPLLSGGHVTCVTTVYQGSSQGGVSCDWANAE